MEGDHPVEEHVVQPFGYDFSLQVVPYKNRKLF
jgi:hypothetical protein